MGDKISQLPAATTVDGTELVPIVQGGATKRVTGSILRSPTGSAGGDLTGSYPNPTLAAITTAQTSVGSQSAIPVVSVDAKGRVVALSTVANPALTTNQIAGLSTAAGAALATAGVVGLSTSAARADHQHARPTPAEIGALGATAAAGGDLVGNYPNPTLAAITTAQSNVGSINAIPVVSVDSKGRITALSSVAFSALTTNQIAGLSTAAPLGLAASAAVGLSPFAARADHQHPFPAVGGDLTGSLPNPTLAAITTAQNNVGSGTFVPVLSIDAKGRVTSLGSTPISGSAGGTVTSITAGAGLDGGTITSSGTIGLAAITTAQSGVGSASQVPVLSINAQGQVTALSSVAISQGGASLSTNPPAALATAAFAGLSTEASKSDHQHVLPTAAQVGALSATAVAGGDLTGNYPSPTLATITSAQSNVGNATAIPVISTDAKGRVTALSTVALNALTTNQIAGLSTAAGAALTTTAIAGVSAFAARADHTHVFPTAAQVGALGATAAAGGDLAGNYPNPTLAVITSAQSNVGSGTVIPVISTDAKGRVTALSTTALSALTTNQIAGLSTAAPAALAASAVVGVSTFAARSDHQHVFPTAAQVGAQAALTTSAPLALSLGGTGAITRQDAMDALAGAVTSGQYLRGNGVDVVMSSIQAGDVPTLNQNTTGTASNVTGIVAIANGGTGANTAAGAASNIGALTTNQISGLSLSPALALAPFNTAGSSTSASRADHQHQFPTAAEVGALGATAAAGGDLTGNYPNPTLASITTSQSNVGSSTLIPVLSIDGKGRVTSLSSVSVAAAAAGTAFKNRLINGDMLIDQRFFGNATTSSIQGYVTDRWYVQQSNIGTTTAQRNAGGVTPPTGFINYLGITVATPRTINSTDFYFITQPIEGQNTRDFAFGTASAATITVSFWAYSSISGTFGGSLMNSTSTRAYVFSYSLPTANTWTKISITIPGDTTGTWPTSTGTGMQIHFSYGVGSSYSGTAGTWINGLRFSATGATNIVGTAGATFYITGIQLERGSTATDFETLPPSVQMQLCQRYYDTVTMWVPAAGSPAQIFYKTIMRVLPTITGGGTGFATTNATLNGVSVTQTTAANQLLVLNAEL